MQSNAIQKRSQSIRNGIALEILKYDNSRLQVNCSNLQAIFGQENVCNRPVSILAIAGAFRKGKSFILSFCLRYLRHLTNFEGSAEDIDNWLGGNDEPLDGFSWKSGTERHTVGVLLWSQPFIVRTDKGEVALFLMDTQGTFDNKGTVRESTFIFALSNLISTVLVYNIQNNIQEDHLQHLQVFTDYGKLVMSAENNSCQPFQKLVFLLRDWPYPFDHPYGAEGGRNYLESVMQPSWNEELRIVREHLDQCYEEISCFLMPHPGSVVSTSKRFQGCLSDIEPEFVHSLPKLMRHLFDNLRPKLVCGTPITGIQIKELIEKYVAVFNANDMPHPRSIYEATSEAHYGSAIDEATKVYEEAMNEKCGPGKWYLRTDALTEAHEEAWAMALDSFKSRPKIGACFEEMFKERLEKDIARKRDHYTGINEHNWCWLNGAMAIFQTIAATSHDALSTITGFFKSLLMKFASTPGATTYAKITTNFIRTTALQGARIMPRYAVLFRSVAMTIYMFENATEAFIVIGNQLTATETNQRPRLEYREENAASSVSIHDVTDVQDSNARTIVQAVEGLAISAPSNSTTTENRTTEPNPVHSSADPDTTGTNQYNSSVVSPASASSIPSSSSSNSSTTTLPLMDNELLQRLKDVMTQLNELEKTPEGLLEFKQEMMKSGSAALLTGLGTIATESPESYQVLVHLLPQMLPVLADPSREKITGLLSAMPDAIRHHPSMKNESVEPLKHLLRRVPGAIDAVRDKIPQALEKFQTDNDPQPLSQLIQTVLDMLADPAPIYF